MQTETFFGWLQDGNRQKAPLFDYYTAQQVKDYLLSHPSTKVENNTVKTLVGVWSNLTHEKQDITTFITFEDFKPITV